jgi:hypothetical protein
MTTNGLLIYSYIRKPFLIYDLATVPLWISLYMRKIWFSFLSVQADILHNFQNGCHNVHQYLLGPQDCIKSDQWKYISTVLEFILSAINLNWPNFRILFLTDILEIYISCAAFAIYVHKF